MRKSRFLSVLLALMVSMSTFAQGILGSVIDENGEPVIGATVVEKDNPQNATITDFDGKFSLKVEAGKTIAVSYVGYVTQEVKAAGGITVVLKEDSQVLSDVVVIGYGVQKKSVVTASIAKVGADELAKSAPVRVDNALQAMVSGVQVTVNSGQPGSASKVRVRGTGTINTASPLYIVDGMAVNGGIDYLNPSDIESIEVLKDAASGAVYGTRAANGVILVTTKSGKLGKTKVTYDVSFGWQNPWRQRKMLNAADYKTLMKEAAGYAGYSQVDQMLSSFGSSDTDWQDVLYNDNAPVQNHMVTVSGATEKINYFFSMGYYDQDGTIGGDYDRSYYRRMSLRGNLNANVFDDSKERSWLNKLDIGFNVGYSRIHSASLGASLTGSALGNAVFLSPLTSVYPSSDEALIAEMAQRGVSADQLVYDRKSGRLLNVPSGDFNEISNPLAYLSTPGSKYNGDKLVSNFYAELNLWDTLKFRTSYGADLAWWGDDSWTWPYYLNKNAYQTQSSVYSDMNRGCRWQLENVLSWNKDFGAHSLAVVLGQSAQKDTGRSLNGTGYDLIAYDGSKANIDFTTRPAGQQSTGGGLYSPYTLASYFGRLSYNYAERYMLQATVRRDGSSNFGTNNKWATFPSLSLGWNVTNEQFLQSRPDWLTNIKVRLSWGKNGNDQIGSFRYTANVAYGNNYAFGDAANQTAYIGGKPSGTPNADLKWEESEQYDAGIDFGFLNNALTFTVDWYKKKTNGMLKTMNIPSYLGESLPWGNVGDMENSGVEFELNYRFNVGKVKFNIGGNASYLKNKLIRLGNAAGFETYDNVHQIGNVSRAENGMPYPFFYGYKTDGVIQNAAEAAAYNSKFGTNAEPGDFRFQDLNGDGVINADDQTMIGKGTPDWTAGFHLGVDWNGFDFNMIWNASFGNDIFNAIRRTDLQWVNLPHEFVNRWHGEGTSNSMPRFMWTSPNQNYRCSDFYVEDGSYIRLKNVQLGYTLPQQFTKKFFVSSLRLYVQAENLFTFTDYTGFEPEISDGTQSGIDRGIYPQNKTITIGANIKF